MEGWIQSLQDLDQVHSVPCNLSLTYINVLSGNDYLAQKLEEFVEELKEDGSWEDLPISRESRDTPDSRDSWEKVNRKPKLSIIGPASIITQTKTKKAKSKLSKKKSSKNLPKTGAGLIQQAS